MRVRSSSSVRFFGARSCTNSSKPAQNLSASRPVTGKASFWINSYKSVATFKRLQLVRVVIIYLSGNNEKWGIKAQELQSQYGQFQHPGLFVRLKFQLHRLLGYRQQ